MEVDTHKYIYVHKDTRRILAVTEKDILSYQDAEVVYVPEEEIPKDVYRFKYVDNKFVNVEKDVILKETREAYVSDFKDFVNRKLNKMDKLDLLLISREVLFSIKMLTNLFEDTVKVIEDEKDIYNVFMVFVDTVITMLKGGQGDTPKKGCI